jgi:outer membrane protein OmpA-like peptidoglycan-associated protein
MRPGAAALVLLAFAGCAEAPRKAPPAVATELVAVIPGPTGHVGAVVVRSGDAPPVVLDGAYSARRVLSDGSTEPLLLTADTVRESFATTIDALPGRPATFLLYFLEGKDELTAASRAEIDKVFTELKRRPAPDIVVTGHTDTVGNLAFNDKLSLARAGRVCEVLVGLGMERNRIQTAGRGKRELLVPTDDNTPEPRNRRVEISVR